MSGENLAPREGVERKQAVCMRGLGFTLSLLLRLLLLLLLLLAADIGLVAAGHAEVRHMEVVGAIALHPETRGRRAPKDAAISQALWEGVSRVGRDLLAEEALPEPGPEVSGIGPEPSPTERASGREPGEESGAAASGRQELEGVDSVRDALGRDMLPFTRGFRIVEDRGESPTLFSDDPSAATEYVVVVDVQVDVDRVRRRLVDAGLLLPTAPQQTLRALSVELRGLRTYATYRRVLDLFLADSVGAKSALPLEFERGRALVRLESEVPADELLDRVLLAGREMAGLSLRPARDGERAANPDTLLLEVHYAPPAPPEEPAGRTELDASAPAE